MPVEPQPLSVFLIVWPHCVHSAHLASLLSSCHIAGPMGFQIQPEVWRRGICYLEALTEVK